MVQNQVTREIEDPRHTSSAGPRLGLMPLLVWIGCCGIYAACARALSTQQPAVSSAFQIALQSVFVGGAWAGLIVLILRGWLGVRWPVGPGHWLLGLLGANLVIQVWLDFVPSSIILHKELILSATAGWLYVLPLFSKGLSPRWRMLFTVVVACYLITTIIGCLPVFGLDATHRQSRLASVAVFAREPIMAGSIAATCVLDLRESIRRDWLHWFGVTVFVAISVIRVFVVVPSM